LQVPDVVDDLALLTSAARDAGEIALRFWKHKPKVWDKGDDGPVTEADIAVNDMLAQTLQAARPDYGWLSEETPDNANRQSARRVFIIDPIDGTRAFIAGEPTFSHSLAIAEDGVVIAGAVFVPAKDRLYAARAGDAATLNGDPIQASLRKDVAGSSVLSPKVNLLAEHWPGGVPDVVRSFRPSLAYRLCLVAQGRADAMLTFRPAWEWDIAAGALIAAQAGGVATDGQGAALRFNQADPRTAGVLVAGSAVHAGLMKLRRG
jgi:myo-inositol-1(or 4)-monophosphatase